MAIGQEAWSWATLWGGALIVDRIEGHAPRLPGDLARMAETLARLQVNL